MVEIPQGTSAEKPDTKGVGILPKLLLLIGVIVLVLWALRGFEFNLVSLFNSVLMVGVAVLLFYLAWLGIKSLRQEKPFSPTDSLTNKFIRIAEMCKPENVKELYLRGDDMRLFSKLGKVTGLLFIPYLVSVPEMKEVPELDSKGNKILIPKRNEKGQTETDRNGEIIEVEKLKTSAQKSK